MHISKLRALISQKNVDFKIVKERKNIAISYFYYLPIHIGKKKKKKKKEECVVNEE